MKTRWDVIVVGAGPAGMACAASCAEQGMGVLVLDEQPSPGGQIYRNIERQRDKVLAVLGQEYVRGAGLATRLRVSGAEYIPLSKVWKVEPDGRVCFSRNGSSREVQGKRVVLAIGAMERPVPFSGWTLPGVVGAGGVDAFLKSDGMVPQGPVAIAGSGPIMLLVVGHLNKLGVEVNSFFDTTPSLSVLSVLPHLPAALRRVDYLAKGVAMLMETRKAAGQYTRGVSHYEAVGTDHVTTVVAHKHGKALTVPASTLLVHEGIIPRTEFTRQLRLAHKWDSVQRYWYPDIDEDGRTSSPAIFVAGDSGFVHGGIAAELKGEITALAIAADLGKGGASYEKRQMSLRKQLAHELLPRPFVDAMYSPRQNLSAVDDDVTVCRCEEVTAKTIRALVSSGQTAPEQVKAVSRCGMGPCQGRMCSSSLIEIMASETGGNAQDLPPLNVRPPVRNIGLGELANATLLPDNAVQKSIS